MLSVEHRIRYWIINRFGLDCLFSRKERALRVLEEAIEYAQSVQIDRDQLYKLIDFVYVKAAGEPKQELAGIYLALIAAASVEDVDLWRSGEEEMARIENIEIEKSRQKHNLKVIGGIIGY